MPGDPKKSHNKKGENDPKDQRKPRGSRKQAPPEKKTEKIQPQKVPEVPKKPPVVEPGPEFYKSLKRETDDILKITEEESSKYKKKEIKSNWAKYEMPIESYDEIEANENLGADYEQLMQAPLSIGGHFQFKHEKSWDINTAPSLYEKYFDINMETLPLAINTIPFYERNDLDKSLFTEIDINNMNNRTIRYKRKYFNDRSYSTSDMQCIENTQSILKDDSEVTEDKDEKNKLETEPILVPEINSSPPIVNVDLEKLTLSNPEIHVLAIPTEHEVIEEVIDITRELENNLASNNTIDMVSTTEITEADLQSEHITIAVSETKKEIAGEDKTNTLAENKNPVIASPEDLEKWLDDFLDG